MASTSFAAKKALAFEKMKRPGKPSTYTTTTPRKAPPHAKP